MQERLDHGWRQVAACVVLLGLCGGITSTYTVVAVPLGREFQPSRMVLMLALTAMSLASAACAPFLGKAMDRWSIKLMMMLGAALVTSGFLALSFVTSFQQVIMIYGLCMAPANLLLGPIAATVLLSRWFVKRRGVALGIAISGVGLGGFMFPPLLQALIDAYEWRPALRLIALILALLALPALLAIANRPPDSGSQSGEAAKPQAASQRSMPSAGRSTRAILTEPTFWAIAAIFSVVLSAMKGVVANLMPMALDGGIAAQDAALIVSLFAGSGFVAKLGFAAISDRFSLQVLIFASLVVFTLGLVCLLEAGSGIAFLAMGVGIVGSSGSFMVPLQGLLVSRIFGADVGRAMGLLSVVTLTATLATPPLFGLIFDLTGSYAGAFGAFTGLAVICLTLVRQVRGAEGSGSASAPVHRPLA